MKSFLVTTCAALGLMTAAASPAAAQGQPYLGQVTFYAFDFCPRGWAGLDGQIMPINANQSLYSLLGTTFGGDGRTSFALPDLRGRAPIGRGQGAGLPDYRVGEKGGIESITLTMATMPNHTHVTDVKATSSTASTTSPGQGFFAGANAYAGRAAPNATLVDKTLEFASVGGGQSFNNMQPYLVTRGCIATAGTFPSRN